LRDAFKRKLVEEAQEVHDAHTRPEMIEELADVLEVIDGLCKVQGISFAEIIAAKKAKRADRGGFEQGIYVDTVHMDDDNAKAHYYRSAPDKYPEIV